jgi:hypothetical protein
MSYRRRKHEAEAERWAERVLSNELPLTADMLMNTLYDITRQVQDNKQYTLPGVQIQIADLEDDIATLQRDRDRLESMLPSQDTTMSTTPALEINIHHVPIAVMKSGLMEKCVAIVRSALTDCGCTGVWYIKSVIRDINTRKNQQTKLNGKLFAVQCCAPLQGQNGVGIKFLVQVHDSREGVYAGVLSTDSDAEVDAAYHTLSKKFSKNATEEAEEQTNQERRTAEVGESYLGKISGIQPNGASITIFPENPPKYQDVFCPINNLKVGYIETNTINEHFVVGQQLLVQVTDTTDDIPMANRKVLLPQSDGFSLTCSGVGDKVQWNMRKFTDSEERILIALDMMRHAIERFATAEAWAKSAEEQHIVGEVFLEDSAHPSAPAYMVRNLVANGIIKLWATPKFDGKPKFVPDKNINISVLLKILGERGYICQSKRKVNGLDRIVAFCMMADGYQALKRKQPPLPVIPTKLAVPPPTPSPSPEPEPEVVMEPEPTPSEPIPSHTNFHDSDRDLIDRIPIGNLTNTQAQVNTMTIAPPEQLDDAAELEEATRMLKLIKEYRVNEKRKTELDHLLENYQSLVAERDLLGEWLITHAAVGETLRLTRPK